MMTACQTVVLQPRSSHTLRPRQPTLRHAGSFGRCSGSSCCAWLLLSVCILVVSGGSSAMPAATVEGHETTAEDLGAMLDEGVADVVILAAGKTRLVVHRAVLAARSKVFTAMFAHDPLPASRGYYVIVGMEGPDLRNLVAFMYSGRAPQLPGMTPQLLQAASKYGLSGLREAFEQQVVRQLTVDNVAAKAVLAVTHDYPTLRKAAVAFIRAHVLQVVATPGWAEAVHSYPGAVVEFMRLLAEATTETSTPATVDSEATNATRPHSDDGRTSAAATPPSAHPHTLTLDDAALSSLSEGVNPHHADDSEATPTTRPHSDHGRIPAAATTPSTCPDTPPLDEAYVSHLRTLSYEEKGWRLRKAARMGVVGEVRALIAAWADMGAFDGNWCTALHHAVWWGHVEAVQCLLQASPEQVAARDTSQWTPLYYAAMRGHVAVLRQLLAANADLDDRDMLGWTPLHWAAFTGHVEVATVLLEATAYRCAWCNWEKEPLEYARKMNHQKVMQMVEMY